LTIEHISQFLAECREATAEDALRVWLFPLSLSRSPFTWFKSLGHFIQRVSAHESLYQESRGSQYQKKVACVGSLESDSKEDNEIGLAKWTRNKNPVSCPWVKANTEKYSFDVNKADQIFDFLLREKQIQLSLNHNVSSADELKNKKYCKWHNLNSHSTNECKVFNQQIQSAIEQGRIQLEESKKPMKIDQHPFPAANVNMVELGGGKTKVLMSERARESGLVDPKVQVLADETKNNDHRARQDDQHKAGWTSGDTRHPRVTSQMLLDKYKH
jgi:hypothetical protein